MIAENISILVNPLSKPIALIKWDVAADLYNVYFNQTKAVYGNGGNIEFRKNTSQSEISVSLGIVFLYLYSTLHIFLDFKIWNVC